MTKLYDAYGNLVDTKLLKQELAAPGLGSVRQVISDHPSSGLTPKRLANLLRAAECGDAKAYLELAEDMEDKYPLYAAQLRTRKLACAGLDVVVKSAGDKADDRKAADLIREVLDNLDVWNILMDALDALGKGYSVMEIMWDTAGKAWLPVEAIWRDPRWFRYDVYDGTTLLMLGGETRSVAADGANAARLPRTPLHPLPKPEARLHPLPKPEARLPRSEVNPPFTQTSDVYWGVPLAPYKFIYHRPRLKSGLPIKGGLARAAAWSYLFSNYVLKDWVAFCEVFGQPIRTGRYPAGTTEEQLSVLKTAVANIGTDCAAVIPDGMLIEFVEAATKTATGELYERLSRYLDERVTVAILGQTLTSGQTQGGGGSMALGKVHDGVRYDLLEADARQLSSTLTRQLARPVIDLNLGPRDAYPKIELFIKKADDLSSLADQLSKLVPLGLRVDAGEIRDRFGLSDPDEGAEILMAQAPPIQRS
jgi:phage gp29-like protein